MSVRRSATGCRSCSPRWPLYPFLPFADGQSRRAVHHLFVYAILALGLNVVVGYTGLLHLGIAAFFGIGAYTVGILTVPFFPFQQSFLVAALAAVAWPLLVGVITTAPMLRLRGDYLALVTLGFGLIALYAIRNLDAITEGTKGLNPIEAGPLPGVSEDADFARCGQFRLGHALVQVPVLVLHRPRYAWRGDALSAEPGAIPARPGVGGAARGRTRGVVHGAEPGPAEARGDRRWCRARRAGRGVLRDRAAHHRQPAGVRLHPVDDHGLLRHPRRARQSPRGAARQCSCSWASTALPQTSSTTSSKSSSTPVQRVLQGERMEAHHLR